MAGLAARVVQAQTASTPPGPTFTGSPANCNKWYAVVSGDNCDTVEKKFGITHDQFISWNPAVSRDCQTNFWLGQAYCPGDSTPAGPTFTGSPSNCNRWYAVVSGDNCETVEKRFSITHDQFISWNPAVSRDCQTNFWLGQAYCVGLGPRVTGSSSSSTTKMTSSSTTTSMSIITPTTPYSSRFPLTNQTILQPSSTGAWPPSKTQAGQPSYCDNWHFVEGGQTCNAIAALYATWMSLDDFHAWNPAVGADCSGLFVHYWVCVGIRPQTQLSLGYETGTPGANATVILPPYFDFTPAPTPTTSPDFAVPLPTHGAMAANCKAYWKASSGNTCVQALQDYPLVSQEQFLSWNPALKGNCNGLWANTWYCAVAFEYADLPMPATVSTRPSPLPAGSTSQCRSWFRTRGPDTCALIVSMFGTFSEADFIAWNPSVGSDCSDIVREGMYYCVGIPGTPTTRSTAVAAPTPPPTGGSGPPGPTQDGIVSDCSSFWLVSTSDTCQSIAKKAGIVQDSLKYWNPALKDDCSGLKPDVYVCIGRPGSSSGGGGSSSSTSASSSAAPSSSGSATTAPTATPTASGTAVPTPLPTQTGMVQGCRKFYYVQSGDGCWAIANANGIELSDFYKWNPAVNNGGECAGLWPSVYVCVGV
ncbi:hypothetical protein Micbo1qcDRAFT_150822 [Microdochium bolleyi]|uniref:LysM domain-containing protein n=1 Tax=Microdochium bolleyi TaxID=196109 RepID=A0A136ITZ4_9PEZI|nr:hypothetical protein Micbo1qcDRAFT_150822 [Microdochium bolleyi]